MTEGQFDHLAQRVDRVAHSAKVVVGDVRPALAVFLLLLGKQLDLRVGADVDDALGGRAADSQAYLLKCEGWRVQHLPDSLRHVRIDPLVPRGGDDVAFRQRSVSEATLQRIRRTLQAYIVLSRS